MSKQIYLEEYTQSSIVVRGNTFSHKEGLKQLGGKWNSRLTGGAGWIFPKTEKHKVQSYIDNTETNDIFDTIKLHVKNMNNDEKMFFISKVSQMVLEKQTVQDNNSDSEDDMNTVRQRLSR